MQNGALGGRTFDVLLTRSPLHFLHTQLDEAAIRHPDRKSLTDYRAPAAEVHAEKDAMAAASRIYTPHAQLADHFGSRAWPLQWTEPPVVSLRETITRGAAVTRGAAAKDGALFFPGPALARNGAWEVRKVAQDLDREVWLCGETESVHFWDGITVKRLATGAWRTAGFWNGVAAVVQPSLGESAPRVHLAALAAGVPVIAGETCGVKARDGLTTVPFGDVEALRIAVQNVLDGPFAAVSELIPEPMPSAVTDSRPVRNG